LLLVAGLCAILELKTACSLLSKTSGSMQIIKSIRLRVRTNNQKYSAGSGKMPYKKKLCATESTRKKNPLRPFPCPYLVAGVHIMSSLPVTESPPRKKIFFPLSLSVNRQVTALPSVFLSPPTGPFPRSYSRQTIFLPRHSPIFVPRTSTSTYRYLCVIDDSEGRDRDPWQSTSEQC
jgi:hypothetical protein